MKLTRSHRTFIYFVFSFYIYFFFHRDELPPEAKAAAEKLGYNKKLWDKDREPPECDEYWEDLTQEQQA